jgi:tRNA (Thr-GGU) A37 N-methylase
MLIRGLNDDETSLRDIKPFAPKFDVRASTRMGWYENRKTP